MTKTNDFRVVVLMVMVAVATSAAALMLVGPPAAAANTLVVDDDKVECENAGFTSIQGAVGAAEEGDLIRVCPGEYHESVVVDKPLTLKGDPDAVEAVDCFDPAVAALDPTRHTIVDPAGTGFSVAFKLGANNIDLSGFVVQGASVGIDASDSFSGYRVHHNLIRLNTLFGMDFGSKGTLQSRVDHNCFRDAASTVINGQNFITWGLVSELDDDRYWLQSVSPVDPLYRHEHARELINAIIDHNSTFKNSAGLEAAGPGHHDKVTFANNVSLNDGTSIVIQNSDRSQIINNQLRPTNFGVSVGGANSYLEITGNEATTGRTGIFFASPFNSFDVFLQPTTNTTVSGNTVTGQTFTGINAQPANPDLGVPGRLQQSDLLNNTSSGNGRHGIALFSGNDDNTVSHNVANENGASGIFAADGATRNMFEQNSMHQNGQNTTLTGIPGTPGKDARDENPLVDNKLQNVWLNNDCDTDFPTGLICGVQ